MLFTSGSKTQSAQEFGRYLYSSPNYVIYNSIQFNSIQLQESTKSNPRHSTHLTTHNKKFISLFTN